MRAEKRERVFGREYRTSSSVSAFKTVSKFFPHRLSFVHRTLLSVVRLSFGDFTGHDDEQSNNTVVSLESVTCVIVSFSILSQRKGKVPSLVSLFVEKLSVEKHCRDTKATPDKKRGDNSIEKEDSI